MDLGVSNADTGLNLITLSPFSLISSIILSEDLYFPAYEAVLYLYKFLWSWSIILGVMDIFS